MSRVEPDLEVLCSLLLLGPILDPTPRKGYDSRPCRLSYLFACQRVRCDADRSNGEWSYDQGLKLETTR